MSLHPVDTLLIVDFGSQVTQLIARRVRELGVYAEILPYHTPAEQLRARDPRAIILSGGPSSLYDEGAPQLDPAVLELGVPVLGICYGLYLIVAGMGGSVVASRREFGAATLEVTQAEGPDDDPPLRQRGDAAHVVVAYSSPAVNSLSHGRSSSPRSSRSLASCTMALM